MIRSLLLCALAAGACSSDEIQLRPSPDAAADAEPAPACVCLRSCRSNSECRDIPPATCDPDAGVCEESGGPRSCETDAACSLGRECVLTDDPASPCP